MSLDRISRNKQAIDILVNAALDSSDGEDLSLSDGTDPVVGSRSIIGLLDVQHSESEDEFLEWEDVVDVTPSTHAHSTVHLSINKHALEPIEEPMEKLRTSKRLKSVDSHELKAHRFRTHNLQMLSYLALGKLRNKWINDSKTQKRLKRHLPEKIAKQAKHIVKLAKMSTSNPPIAEKTNNICPISERELVYVLKYLIKWFRKNFSLSCNSIRNLGYLMSPKVFKQKKLLQNVENYYRSGPPDMCDIAGFRRIASKMSGGNRDIGSQLFTALLRSLGFYARLVFSIPLLSVTKDANHLLPLDPTSSNNFDYDLLFPTFWTELISPIDDSEVYIIDSLVFHNEWKGLLKLKRYQKGEYGTRNLLVAKGFTKEYYPRGPLNQMTMQYVVAYEGGGSIIDVSGRYMPNISYRNFDVLGFRPDAVRSFLMFKGFLSVFNKRKPQPVENHTIEMEVAFLKQVSLANFDIPSSVAGFRKNPNVIISSLLYKNQIVDPLAVPVGQFKRNAKEGQPGATIVEAVYLRSSILNCKSLQHWKILGRDVKLDELNLPSVVTKWNPQTLPNRRQLEYNKKNDLTMTQNLYAFYQTQFCPPIHITDTQIPKNDYGNIEIFKSWMIPEECIILKFQGLSGILSTYNKKVEAEDRVDFAPVVSGFNFSYNKATPVLDGVLVHARDSNTVKRIWFNKISNLRRLKKQKQEAEILNNWRMVLAKLRIRDRIQRTYGLCDEEGTGEVGSHDNVPDSDHSGFFQYHELDSYEAVGCVYHSGHGVLTRMGEDIGDGECWGFPTDLDNASCLSDVGIEEFSGGFK
ncbi:hypothetical protein BABINDRAFT_161079 [Babjeviella inositovora NRRL Y-12698]|uniref:Rad4 beta-hairpin domain-containing protein n=1 Tax=Babjeviella inositovora NRRL Y-12698 TaxID=984486 RepID=A0A1E3QT41_9ASCO|nr:uncharacterized protein BABINDRAFT_161079 [Babjeviella inositovora NRRL Y-12698]ODQ80087.1 hypothetical protein BABINDRAFT_161079 [Babjeviella inositovora NRRL Y-12698]